MLKQLTLTVLGSTAVILAQSLTSSAQAATLGGSGTCANVSFNYIDCAGAFSGNDKGAQGTGLSNLDALFGSGWSFAGDNEDSTVSFTSGGDGTKVGSASTNLSGFGAIAVKAGNSYSLYTVADLSSFDWSTEGVTPVGRGNTPGLSHLSVYKQAGEPEPESKSVPEPGLLLGFLGLVGTGVRLKKN
ncbi:hypothetical protein [Adonisia turfae]|uniref:PEP-CTERM sorting domain-containing protein n=1 Tax=Adonisia turfae CCMR0081 TaxID=2292702 RepID=A0A6M0RGR0_9CYAN|nr:hypothetical protein [Adonisia turfae]NEZ55424.1 hypothetical protein [Adonisia turfae CCMR0081]